MRGADGSKKGVESNPGPASSTMKCNYEDVDAEEDEDVNLDESGMLLSFSLDTVTILVLIVR